MSLQAMPVQVALVDETGTIDQNEMVRVVGALNEQILSDFGPVWHVRASVGMFYEVTPMMWAVRIRRRLDEPGALGYHTDEHGQPEAFIMLTDDWPATAAHEIMEMLADPFGNRMHGARLPAGLDMDFHEFGLPTKAHHVHYLLEVCDPPEATSYEVGGVALSDFVLPSWYRTNPGQRFAFSHAGACDRPREVAPGGYVSFANDAGEWFQAFADSRGRLQVQHIGRFDRRHFGSLREFTDARARDYRKHG